MKVAIHITHEAVQKIGGIGSVIHGLCSAEKYSIFFDKTVLYGPLFSSPSDVFSRLGKGGIVLYSDFDSYDKGNYHEIFYNIINKYSINIIYGKRVIANEFNVNKKNEVDVVLVGINNMNIDKVNRFKYCLWEEFGIRSENFPDNWDYEQYLRIAVMYLEIIEALYPDANHYYHFAHEYMGIPSCLTLYLAGEKGKNHKTIFYAHEISPSRIIVETHPGHDISFYNVMNSNRKIGKTLEQEYGQSRDNYRSELVKRTDRFDYIFAVGDMVKEEYQYLMGSSCNDRIKVVYNGVPTKFVTEEKKLESKNLVCEYINKLFNFRPDVIFTHVTRLVVSKGIWRDIAFLYYLDNIFSVYELKGVYILLSTLIGHGRNPEYIYRMESEYGWPVKHRKGWPDLVGMEEEVYEQISTFNAKSNNIKAVFLNQYDFNRRRCGLRVPGKIDFIDLRIASDAEFGFSIYEPFGIAQLETIPFGGLAAVSSSCGCSYMLSKIFSGSEFKPFYIFDFIGKAGNAGPACDFCTIDSQHRFEMEKSLLEREAKLFFEMLPKTDGERTDYLVKAQQYIDSLGWEKIVDFIDPATL